MTHFESLSFNSLKDNISSEIEIQRSYVLSIKSSVDQLKSSGFWVENVPHDFRFVVTNALNHYENSIDELTDINEGIEIEVKENHVQRLKTIAEVAHQINVDIGRVWNRDYDNKDYDDHEFLIIDRTIYPETRDMAVNLSGLSRISDRLKDFVGRNNKTMKEKNNPLPSGLFYVITALIFFVAAALCVYLLGVIATGVIVIAVILIVSAIAFLQLRNDEVLSDSTFLKLYSKLFKSLKMLNRDED